MSHIAPDHSLLRDFCSVVSSATAFAPPLPVLARQGAKQPGGVCEGSNGYRAFPLQRRRQVVPVLALRAQQEPAQASGQPDTDPVRKNGLLAFWGAFILYATFLAPNADPEVSKALLPDLLKFPPDGSINPIFLAVFGMLGVWPAVMAALLIPLQPKAQSLKAWPFVTASFALGAFGLTPYLAMTSYEEQAPVEASDSTVSAFVGSRGFGLFQLASTVLAYVYASGLFQPNNINGGSDFPVDVIFSYFLKLYYADFSAIKLVNIPSCDFVALWLLSSKPLYEDMRRRGWMKTPSDFPLFLTFMLTPLIGACTWLVVRPPIEQQSSVSSPADDEMR